MSDKLKCPYCNKELTQITGSHLSFKHGKTVKDLKIDFPDIWELNYELTREKIKEGCIKKFGVDNPSKCKEVKDKIKNTFLEKYGVTCSLHNEEVQKKVKETNLKKYGKEYYFSSDNSKEKIKKTNIRKYGVKHSGSIPRFHEKAKKTNLIKFGVDNPSKCKEVKDKIKNTFLEKYGVENASQVEEFKEKVRQTKIKNGNMIPDDKVSEFQLYARKVNYYTYESIKKKFSKEERNSRGKAGIEGAFQVDHIYSIYEGFINNIDAEIIGHPCNLQLVDWRYNDSKKTKSEITIDELKLLIESYNKMYPI